MKFNFSPLLGSLLFFALCFGCSKSSTKDDPTPTPTPTPTPIPTDYSSCKYTFTYKLSYSPLNKNKPTTVTYLDADQKVKTTTLADTSFTLAMNYKYGDSVYVKLSPGMYFLNVGSGSKNKLSKTVTIATQTGTCPIFKSSNDNQSNILDSIPASGQATVSRVYGVSPLRLSN